MANNRVRLHKTGREVLSKDTQQIMLAAVLTAIVVAVCIVLGANFIEDINYNGKLLKELNTANHNLEQNLKKFSTLEGNVNTLNEDQSLRKLRINPDSTRGSLQVVFDSMPTVDNRSALAASLQTAILNHANVSVQSINVNDNSAAENATASKAKQLAAGTQEVKFNVVLVGSYDAIQDALSDMERSIRPITITGFTITGGAELRASVSGTTYYTPMFNYKLGSKEVGR